MIKPEDDDEKQSLIELQNMARIYNKCGHYDQAKKIYELIERVRGHIHEGTRHLQTDRPEQT